jgi:hypothetical protein
MPERPKFERFQKRLVKPPIAKRKSKKIGSDKKLANEVAEKIKAKLVLGELNIEKIEEPRPTFKEYAELWLNLPMTGKNQSGIPIIII